MTKSGLARPIKTTARSCLLLLVGRETEKWMKCDKKGGGETNNSNERAELMITMSKYLFGAETLYSNHNNR